MQKLRQNSDFILAVGLIGIFVPLIVYVIRHQFNIFGQVIFALGFIFLGLYVGLEWPRLLRTLRGRQVRYGGNALLMSLIFIGIIALASFMSQRYFKRFDLTANQSFSISEQTGKVLDNLDRSVKIWAFYSSSGDRTTIESLLKSYQLRGRGKVSYEFVDPDARPTFALQYGLESGESNVLVFETDARQQKVTGSTESDITSALLRLTAEKQKVIYLLTGHGEYSPDDSSQNGLLIAKQALGRENYSVKTLNLIVGAASTVTTTTGITLPVAGSAQQYAGIPADADAIIIAAPQSPIAGGEWQIISQWLNNGGKLFLLMDGLGSESGLEDMLLANWGLAVRDDLVIDPYGSIMGDVSTLVIQSGDFSPITQNLRAQAILPGARSLQIVTEPGEETKLTVLAATSDQSWGETDLANLTSGVRLNAGVDAAGPLPVAVSVERTIADGTARLIVYGNARFATDRYAQSGGNLDFFVNAVNWLVEDEELISIRPRQTAQEMLYIPTTDARLLAIFVALAMPLLALVLGGIVWWRRR